ncbi:hypothetical protein SAMN05518672_103202 [Chitinophaga sp. CF118]|uniref:hypothetical protein n=1 Tax=Chitinophaga sp. CF118 TaxID=1884367 RepID=UPI0008DF3FC3|nr:hypothetical protein [Chitinophaga sp. CF118]SFD78371.1 hypothetical protein SAMN05518672_103202 [Chitinophaga sp. CF118]
MKKQLLKFGLMAGMGVFVLTQTYAKDAKALTSNVADTITMRDTVNALDTASMNRDTANFVLDTASFAHDTANFVLDTASFAHDTASFVRDTANFKDTANFVFKADTANFKSADTASAFKSDTAAFKADTANFAYKLSSVTADTAAMKADTAAFKKDTARVLGQNIVSFRKDTTTPQPTDTTAKPKAVKE